jgi:hypothetical protein
MDDFGGNFFQPFQRKAHEEADLGDGPFQLNLMGEIKRLPEGMRKMGNKSVPNLFFASNPRRNNMETNMQIKEQESYTTNQTPTLTHQKSSQNTYRLNRLEQTDQRDEEEDDDPVDEIQLMDNFSPNI